MFAKLLKYDFRATWGLIGGLSIIALGAGALGSVLARMINRDPKGFYLTLLIFAMIAVVVYLVGYSLASMFILFGRFYKSRFTDEGYMTFTLPVTTHQVLLSSFLNCLLGIIVSILVTILAFGIMVFFGTVDLDGERWEFVKYCADHLFPALGKLGVGNILSFLMMILAGLASEILFVMFAITIGSVIAKKHKILAGVGSYYALHIATGIASTGLMISIADVWTENDFLGFAWATIAWSAAISLVFYFAMHYLTNRKLNLN